MRGRHVPILLQTLDLSALGQAYICFHEYHDSLGIFRVSESHMRARAGPSKLDRMYLVSHLVAHECDPVLCWLPLAVGPGILVRVS